MIKIFTGWSHVGGSTIAFINLVNLFNKNGIKAKLYGPHEWHLNQCISEQIDYDGTRESLKPVIEGLETGDTVMVHFLPMAFENSGRGFLNRSVYCCHETNVLPINKVKYHKYDFIHYVSEFQRLWHDIS